MEDKGARYFEGFVLVLKGMTPSEHAWVVMQDGRVVDFTLEALEVTLAGQRKSVDLRGFLYVGLEVPKTMILDRLAETDWYDSISEHYYADHLKRIANRGQ